MTKNPDVILPAAFEKGGYVARFVQSDADLQAAQALRHLCFVERAGRAPLPDGRETDRFDAACDHVLIEDKAGAILCCFRLMALPSGAKLEQSYSAQFYDLSNLHALDAPLVELGRFCIHPEAQDSDVLRMAWGMLAAYVDAHNAALLFGCSSFEGTDAGVYSAGFDLLAARYLASAARKIGRRDGVETVAYGAAARPVRDHPKALAQVPALLRSYLSMGGWVSDHAVIDRHMNTLHVFTGLEIAAIPEPRAKALRKIAS